MGFKCTIKPFPRLSAENPPPFCESDVTHLAYICVRFYNMSYSGKIGGCLQLECRVLEKFNISMGCFYFPDNPSDVLTEGRTGVKKILDNHVKEAQKTLKNLLGIIKEAPVLSEPDSKPSVARDKVVLSEEMCKCRPGKTIDCRCCAPVTDSQGRWLWTKSVGGRLVVGVSSVCCRNAVG